MTHPVSQRARAAAGVADPCNRADYKLGLLDSGPVAQAFAKFEADVVEGIAKWIDNYEPVASDMSEFEAECFAAERIAGRLRGRLS